MSKRRYLYAAAGVLVMLCAGFIYAWSVLAAPIAIDFPQWSNAQLSLTFTLCMSFFCLGGIAAGFLSKRIPVQVNGMISAALFLVGFFLTARVESLTALYVSYGVLCGTASGFSYNSVMNIIPRWFPERQGLISGVLLMGFGASSMVIGSVFTALTPEQAGAWRITLPVLGVLMAVIIFAGAFFFVPPKVGEVPTSSKQAENAVYSLELSPSQMLRCPSFWYFFLWSTLMSAVGLVIIAQARNLVVTAAPGLDAAAISFAVGLISVFNGLGRVLLGGLFDKIGRTPTMFMVGGFYLAGILLLWTSLSGSAVLLILGIAFIGLGYGGGPTLSAAVIKRFYGQQNYPMNFSIMNLSLLTASFAAAASGAVYDAQGSFVVIFLLLLALIAVAVVSMRGIRHP